MEAEIEHAASLEASLERAEAHDKRAHEHGKLDMRQTKACALINGSHKRIEQADLEAERHTGEQSRLCLEQASKAPFQASMHACAHCTPLNASMCTLVHTSTRARGPAHAGLHAHRTGAMSAGKCMPMHVSLL